MVPRQISPRAIFGPFPSKTKRSLNAHVIDTDAVSGAETSQNTEVGVGNNLFARTSGTAMTSILDKTQIVEFDYRTMDDSNNVSSEAKFLVHSYYGRRPELSVYNERVQTDANADGNTVEYDAAQNTLTIQLTNGGAANFVSGESIRLAGVFDNQSGDTLLNGRELTIFSVDTTNHLIKVDTTGLSLPDTNFSETLDTVYVLRDEATDVEAFFEGAANVYEGSEVNFNSKKIILRETGASNMHSYTNTELQAQSGGAGIFDITGETLSLVDDSNNAIDALEELGLEDAADADATSTKTVWVDELQPPIKVGYDEINQRLTFKVDRTVLGTGTNSNFNSFKVSGSTTAEQTNNLGIPSSDDAAETLIRGGEVFLPNLLWQTVKRFN